MNRFTAGLGGIKEASGKAKPKTIAAVAPPDPAPVVSAPIVQPPSRQGKVAIAAYFDPAVRKQLAILSVKEDRSQAALLAEALNLLFERYGEPTIANA